jgi:hypothetical protein
MAQGSVETGGTGPSHRSVEIGVAASTAAFALIVIAGSVRAGMGWGIEGPQAGFFPFYIGLLILGASIANCARAFLSGRGVKAGKLFAQWGQLRQVLSVVIPSAVYVGLVPVLGIYISSMLLIGVFMKWLGKYGWGLVLAVALGVPVVAYITFEIWFLVPLPKGPVEDLLHL